MKTTLVALLLILSLAASAAADTFVVDNTVDPGDGICGSPGCTLREAITAANTNPGADVINFNFPTAGVHTITPASPLPDLTEAVTIDGYTQPGASENSLAAGDDAVLLIQLNGTTAGGTGLTINASGCIIRGLVIGRFSVGLELASSNNVVEGNFIGTNTIGTVALGNSTGVFINGAGDNTVGGITPSARNVISGNDARGVLIGFSATDNLVQGNFIGTDASGTADLKNAFQGVNITDSSGNTIGGVTAGARNVIAANLNGVQIVGPAGGNIVQGNYIGTDVTGMVDLALDDTAGVGIVGSPDNLIGGAVPGAGNLISGNLNNIEITGAASTGNLIQSNLIGTDATGTAGLDFFGPGILITGGSASTIGGPAGAGNVIAFNGASGGIAITAATTGNNIFGNSIFANDGIGINLVGGTEDAATGVTANDFPDSDAGANNLQNYPVISEIAVTGQDRSVEGSLTSNPNTDYVVDFYSNAGADASGYGEGETWLGSLDLHTNAQSAASFSFPLDAGSIGRFITATATDPDGNTSEFSLASEIVPALSRFLNISTRLRVQTGDNVLIGGFIITGNDPKEVIVRAIGPSLGGQGVQGFLANPTLELNYPDGNVVSNDDWKDDQEAEITATGIPPTDDLESAIVATLDPGAYTAIVRGVGNGTGVGLVEAYDLGQEPDANLANISTRGFVETADNVMIGGIIVGPEIAADGSILLRGLGPSLTPLGVPNALADPTLELRDSNGLLVTSNDNWKSTQQAEIEATGVPPTDDNEAAILATLASGSYTAILQGVGGGTGVGLVEAYHLD